jgi:allantoin racemase
MLADLHAADSAGIGGVVIGNIQDPGLYEARQACNAPVVGLLESTVLATRPFGASVGLLASAQRVIPLLQERLRQYNAAVSGIEVCGRDLPSWSRTFTDPGIRSEAIGDVLSAARRAVRGGAEIIVPASGIVTAMLATEYGVRSAWQPDPGLPAIINPIYVAVAHCVMAMQLREAGLGVSRAGTYERPTAEELEVFFR